MSNADPFANFIAHLKMLAAVYPTLLATTLGNIFTMRRIGNKTHGDLAEIAMVEFINQYMTGFRATHVGRDLYRAKSREEDIRIVHETTHAECTVSLKAYGVGPLQLSTDKNALMFARLQQAGKAIQDTDELQRIFADAAFAVFSAVNVLPLIYDEKARRCNILVFDSARAQAATTRIVLEFETPRRRHPVYRFYDTAGDYICAVRYGDAAANALQRGLWTHTRHAQRYFDSVTGGWMAYTENHALLALISQALVAPAEGHAIALARVQEEIARFRLRHGAGP